MKKRLAALMLAALAIPALPQTNAQYVQAMEADRHEAARTIAAQQDIAVIGQAQ